MRYRIVAFAGLSALGLFLWAAVPAIAQTPKASSKPYSPPRMPDGHPDLQGTYDLATITPLQRASGSLVVTPEEAAKREKAFAAERAKGDAPIQADRTAPPKGGDGSPGPYGNVGGYNSGWLDPGSTLTVVDGQKRASLIIDPPNGRLPAFVPGAAQRLASYYGRPTSDQTESNDPGLDHTPGAYDDPERRPLGERCILGFGSTSGPPSLPDYFYNNLHQIIQTPDTIMINTEMVHDARVIHMNRGHLPQNIRLWMGDSVGHWEGDTLVVDTTNFNDKTGFYGSTEKMHVVERFTRVGPGALLYRFTVDDPQTWTRPWTGEFTWPATDAHIYEYACHEGNYALMDIMKGARLRDKEEAAAKTTNQ